MILNWSPLLMRLLRLLFIQRRISEAILMFAYTLVEWMVLSTNKTPLMPTSLSLSGLIRQRMFKLSLALVLVRGFGVLKDVKAWISRKHGHSWRILDTKLSA